MPERSSRGRVSSRARHWVGCIFVSAAALAGCEPGGVGDPCIPDAEYSTTFSPFSIKEVYFEVQSMTCETRVCLVNHFQGRVSCPLGQSDSTSEPACYLPGTPEGEVGTRVEGPVPAWDLDRPPERSVYCSCRCDGPDPGARYCECPSGYACTELAPEGISETKQGLKGSYCVKSGTQFSPTEIDGPTCADTPSDERCRSVE
jgi:hypothetical protein